jgi:predicted transcriptional regulator
MINVLYSRLPNANLMNDDVINGEGVQRVMTREGFNQNALKFDDVIYGRTQSYISTVIFLFVMQCLSIVQQCFHKINFNRFVVCLIILDFKLLMHDVFQIKLTKSNVLENGNGTMH